MTSNKTTNYNLYIRSFIRYKKGVCISGTPSRQQKMIVTYSIEHHGVVFEENFK